MLFCHQKGKLRPFQKLKKLIDMQQWTPNIMSVSDLKKSIKQARNIHFEVSDRFKSLKET